MIKVTEIVILACNIKGFAVDPTASLRKKTFPAVTRLNFEDGVSDVQLILEVNQQSHFAKCLLIHLASYEPHIQPEYFHFYNSDR